CSGLAVTDVLTHAGMSRASLQQRMKQLIGRTIHQEIQRVRLQRVRELLTSSRLTIKQIARESGFASVQYMTRVFHAATGETPARYRWRRSISHLKVQTAGARIASRESSALRRAVPAIARSA